MNLNTPERDATCYTVLKKVIEHADNEPLISAIKMVDKLQNPMLRGDTLRNLVASPAISLNQLDDVKRKAYQNNFSTQEQRVMFLQEEKLRRSQLASERRANLRPGMGSRRASLAMAR